MKAIEIRQEGSDTYSVWITEHGSALRRKKKPLPAGPVCRRGRELSFEPDGEPGQFSKDEAAHIAHKIGRYMLGLGDLVFSYTAAPTGFWEE